MKLRIPLFLFYVLFMALTASFVAKAQQSGPVTDITFFCTDWGRKVPWDEYCKRVRDAGFDGIETWAPTDQAAQEEMLNAFKKYNLAYIFLCTGSGADFDTFFASYKKRLEQAVALHPVLINSHTGKDHFDTMQNEALINLADSISRAHQVPVTHETHRGRFSFAAHITQQYLERLPHLRLALDISHWCNVHESMLDDQPEAVSLALQRTDHIHARVGHPEGPQVNDPRAPEWETVVQRHLEWWDAIVAAHREQGKPLTFTMEFGPPDYLPTLPYTRQPVADQWDMNTYMFTLLKTRYEN